MIRMNNKFDRLKHLNHNWVVLNKSDSIKCEKCNTVYITHYHSKGVIHMTYIGDDGWKSKYIPFENLLSCDEIIIKNILE